MSKVKVTVPNRSSPRPFRISYAGAFDGHAKTREGAINAAMRHCVQDGYNKATITHKYTEQDVARVWVSKDRLHAHVEVLKPLRKINFT